MGEIKLNESWSSKPTQKDTMMADDQYIINNVERYYSLILWV